LGSAGRSDDRLGQKLTELTLRSVLSDIDLALVRDALASSTLNHGLQVVGDRWTVALLLDAFLGVRRFEVWQSRQGIPRHTLTQRLSSLVEKGIFERRAYQQRPARFEYRLTSSGLALYDQVLMMWAWERRWGTRQLALPKRLVHQTCGHAFLPELSCKACGEKVGLTDLTFSLNINKPLLAASKQPLRSARLAPDDSSQMGLGLRVDRWAILIVSALFLGVHYFDHLSRVLQIGSSVLTRRLASMVDSGLLVCQTDLIDARRKIYRLTPASRDLFGYILCISSWASNHHLRQTSSISPTHKNCGQPYVPQVSCSACHQPLKPRDVRFS
jgi:DNA-binding HxlR family transcriptional regulator